MKIGRPSSDREYAADLGYPLRVRALAASSWIAGSALLLASPISCDTDDDPFAALPCPIVEESCQQAVYRAAAEVAQLPVADRPPVRTLPVHKLEAELVARSEATPEDAHVAASWDTALQLLGLLPTGMSSRDALLAARLDHLAAYYDTESKRVTVVDRGRAGADEQDLLAFAQELTHALRDGENDLDEFRTRYAVSTDSFIAINAAIEGEATLVGSALVTRVRHGPQYAEALDLQLAEIADGVLDAIDRSPAPFVTAVQQLPYVLGPRALRAEWEVRGRALIDPLYEQPLLPLLRWTFLEAPHQPLPPPVCYPTLPPTGYLVEDSDTLGLAAVLALPVALGGSSARKASAASLGWRADSLVIFRPADDPENPARAVAWRVRFDGEEHARAFELETACCLNESTRYVRIDDEVLLVAASDEATLTGWGERVGIVCGSIADLPAVPHEMSAMASAAAPGP